MINNNYILVVDIETDGINPRTCNPIQLAGLIVHPRTLEVIVGSEFSSMIKPDDFGKPEYVEKTKDTYKWHADQNKTTLEEFLKRVEDAPSEKTVWKNFIQYTKNWHKEAGKSSSFSAPILAGHNLFEYDKIILDRLAAKYKNVDKYGAPTFYNKRDTIDTLKIVFAWNESLTFLPNYKLDTLREKFDIDSEGYSHEALKDCKDTAILLAKYLKLHRYFSQKVKGWT